MLQTLPRRCPSCRTNMDAYSICYTSPSHRGSSRIYRDLRSARPYTVPSRHCDQSLRNMAAMDASSQVC